VDSWHNIINRAACGRFAGSEGIGPHFKHDHVFCVFLEAFLSRMYSSRTGRSFKKWAVSLHMKQLFPAAPGRGRSIFVSWGNQLVVRIPWVWGESFDCDAVMTF